jgi:riboflavin synthase
VFTGIVEGTGSVVSAERRGDVLSVRIRAGALVEDMAPGSSISVSGCCLTATAVSDGTFTSELTEETLRRTSFGGRMQPGRLVNLERPLRADGRFDGHIVQGHVDGVGRITSIVRTGAAAELWVEPPPALARYLVEKGSVALDGISLTVASLELGRFSVALIPLTLQLTNLGQAAPGDPVNLEVDVIAKYVERLLGERQGK